MGRTFPKNLERYCKVVGGYAELKSVVTKERSDRMESFFFAETLKYLYLLFAPPETLDFRTIVFNTEAHPLRRTWEMELVYAKGRSRTEKETSSVHNLFFRSSIP